MMINGYDIKTKGDLLNYLTDRVIEYAPECKSSICRNTHMNEVSDVYNDTPSQAYIDAILVDFINYVGVQQGLDWGLYTEQLYKKLKTSEEWQKLCKVKVMDPDGWDRSNNYHYDWYEKKISRLEFEKRLAISTVSGGYMFGEGIWKDQEDE